MIPSNAIATPVEATTGATSRIGWWVCGVLGLLWLQLYAGTMGIWRDGEYYGYGWYVPPLALWLAWRRLPSAERRIGPPARFTVWHALLIGAAILWLPVARAFVLIDGVWRPPILLHALLVAGVTLACLSFWRGWRWSLYFAPVVIFALVAMPLPIQLEKALIGELTAKVVALTREFFLWNGHAVEVLGDRLVLDGVVVEVSEGCSGVRSLQTLLMAGLFFGEFFRLHIVGRIVLLCCAAIAALVVNAGRAIYLGQTTFARGHEAADAAHDPAGMIAFLIAATGLLLAARLCLGIEHRRNRNVVRRLVSRNAT